MSYNNAQGDTVMSQDQSVIFEQQNWPPSPFSALGRIKRTSNQILEKNTDGSLHGVRYVIAAEPSSLRPIRSWTINIEKWSCENLATITAEDILFIRIANMADNALNEYGDIVRDIVVNSEKREVDNQIAFNAVMAAILFTSKIDANRMPNIDKTLSLYQLA